MKNDGTVLCECGVRIVPIPGVRSQHCAGCGGHSATLIAANPKAVCARCIPIAARFRRQGPERAA